MTKPERSCARKDAKEYRKLPHAFVPMFATPLITSIGGLRSSGDFTVDLVLGALRYSIKPPDFRSASRYE